MGILEAAIEILKQRGYDDEEIKWVLDKIKNKSDTEEEK